MRGSEAPAAGGADDGVTRRIHALLDPAQTPGFDWRGELREGGHRKKVQAYGLSFAEKCIQAERFADARLLLEAYAQARRAAGLPEDRRALELQARVSAASKGEAAADDATGGGGGARRSSGGRPSLSAQERPSLSRCNTPETQAGDYSPHLRGGRTSDAADAHTPLRPPLLRTPTSNQHRGHRSSERKTSGGGLGSRDSVGGGGGGGARYSPPDGGGGGGAGNGGGGFGGFGGYCGSGARLLSTAQKRRGLCSRLPAEERRPGYAAAAEAGEEAHTLNVSRRGDERLAFDLGRLRQTACPDPDPDPHPDPHPHPDLHPRPRPHPHPQP